MRLSLKPHPDAPSAKVTAVEVELVAYPYDLLIRYFVTGSGHLVLPKGSPPRRREKLWETTCFEAFLKPVGGEAYFEYNFSPSTEWAAYRFERRREGRRPLQSPVDPFVTPGEAPSDPILEANVDLSPLPNAPLDVNLCAVIEERGGRKSYWALAHPPGEPDFHHPSCFTLQLPAPRPE